ncbi:MAG TPA: hypothetical protein ENG11_01785, partial [candidate division Zixibacteria bacterium]|nr:hypothetical protein [candidate division Zixibacteria bacterium]
DQLIAMGILCGFEATPPDRFAVGAWSTFYDVEWDLTPSHSDYWDSAVLIWWYPVEVCPGETLEVATYYGLGKPVAANLVIQIPEYPRVEDCWYEPDTFVVQTSFTNGLGTVLHDCVATIDLPDGLSLAPGYDATRSLSPSTLASGGTGNTGWEVVINHAPAEDESICVYVTSPSYDTVFIKCEPFSLPEIIPPTAEIAEPLPMTVSACPEQQLVLNVNFPNGYNNLQFMIDGEVVDPSEISLVDDTLLVYTPTEPWENGTHTFGLVHMDDALGCELDSVLGSFEVDVAPPVVSDESPADGDVLGTPDFGTITVDIVDNERSVDPASIVFAVNGDTFMVDDSILTYDGTTLTFDPAAAGLSFADGDTICCAVVDAADDSVDYCEPNHISEPYEWCFSINIVDIALPDTFGHAGDVVEIPVYTEDLARFGITSLDITISYFPSVLTPVDVVQTGTVTESWGDLTMEIPSPGTVHITGSGPELGSGDVLFYIQFVVGPHMGAFSRLDFEDATFNEGSLASNTRNGFFTVLWDPVQWSGTMFFYTKNMPVHHLTFGASATATDGYDPDIDVIHIPPTISDVNAWFNLDDPEHPSIRYLDRDFRYSGDTDIVWTGEATYDAVGETVWVYWNPSSFPDGLLLLTYSTPEGDITLDMKSDTIFTFTDSTHFEIHFLRGELHTQSISVCPGWNLLSLPVLPTGSTPIREIIPGAITDGYWYNPLFHGYDILISPVAGKAFWVFTLNDGEVPLAGMDVPTVAVHLYRGWNMVGMPSTPEGYVLVSDLSTTPAGAIFTTGIFGYDACETHGYYPVSETLYVGRGYWIYATEECNLTIGDALLKGASSSEFEFEMGLSADGIPLTIAVDKDALPGVDEYDVPVPPATPEGEVDMPALKIEGQKFIRSVSSAGEFVIDAAPGTHLA